MSLKFFTCECCGKPASDLLARGNPSKYCQDCKLVGPYGRVQIMKKRMMEALKIEN